MANTEWLKEIGAVPTCDWHGRPLTIDGVPVRLVQPEKPKHSLPNGKQEYLIFKFDQFPYAEGCDIKVSWEASDEDNKLAAIAFDIGRGYGLITVHPYTFCRMIGEHYGSDRAFDFLKLMMRDRIDNLTAQYFKPIEERLNRTIHYGGRSFDRLDCMIKRSIGFWSVGVRLYEQGYLPRRGVQ
jgi:hypothetical protein